jgi:hypothetical protein
VAANLHIEGLAWLRYTKQMPLVCTEVGRWNADVLGIGPKYSIELEVKKSISDLRADFKNKRSKHWHYAQPHASGSYIEPPNYLYYLVPEVLRDKALVVLESQNPKYGLLWVPALGLSEETNSLGYGVGKNVQVGKKAQRLHSNPPSDVIVRGAMKRLSSELVGLYQAYEHLETTMKHSLEEIRANVRATAAIRAAFTPVPPELEQFLEEQS